MQINAYMSNCGNDDKLLVHVRPNHWLSNLREGITDFAVKIASKIRWTPEPYMYVCGSICQKVFVFLFDDCRLLCIALED